ncbi:methyltransferase family protein [Hydrogenispora ethanolica]|uniref:Methyltransferase family protein n=1 Tax=Hydrogenispora ethanolica TaxID=1082276 RepID=A0A4R1QXR3_HYDET|nr:methyltransferase family protein [Hydrogenispora ethanolica]
MAEAALTFNEVAELYHEIRPRYPESLFADLVKLTNLPNHARVLEIGAGTGIATVELVRRGLQVVALEPGPAMAAILKRNLKDCQAEVIESKFEDWEPPIAKFDLVVSFTAFHWSIPKPGFKGPMSFLLHPDISVSLSIIMLQAEIALSSRQSKNITGNTSRMNPSFISPKLRVLNRAPKN